MRSFKKLTIAAFVVTVACAAAPAVAGEAPASDSADHLKPLEGLVGDWVAESNIPGEKTVKRTITYEWMYGRT